MLHLLGIFWIIFKLFVLNVKFFSTKIHAVPQALVEFFCCSTPLASCCLPADYTVTQLEALTILCHYCLLDSTQQLSHAFSQQLLTGSGTIHMGIPGANPGQIFNNLIHVFMPTPLQQVLCLKIRLLPSGVFAA